MTYRCNTINNIQFQLKHAYKCTVHVLNNLYRNLFEIQYT